MDDQPPNARFIMKCKLTGNGATNFDAEFHGTLAEIKEYEDTFTKDGYTASDRTIEPYHPTIHKLDERYLAED